MCVGLAMMVATELSLAGCSQESRITAPQRIVGVRDVSEVASTDSWQSRTDDELWSVIAAHGRLAIIGFHEPGSGRGIIRGRIVVSEAMRGFAKADLKQRHLTIVDSLEAVPAVLAIIPDSAALQVVRHLPYVDYIEPATDPSFVMLDVCGTNDWDWSAPRYTASPGDLYGQGYVDMNIPLAWPVANGAGVTVGIVDTGIDSLQPELLGEFATGMSNNGRSLRYSVSFNPMVSGTSLWDHCGHGTKIAAVIGAPRNGTNMLGVAWGANLWVYKVQSDPLVISDDLAFGVADAIISLAPSVRIIQMAFGTGMDYTSISDAISAAYYNNDVLFVAAAGNTRLFPTDGLLVFPARDSLVTAIAARNSDCSDCARGSKVEFAVPTGLPAAGAIAIGFQAVSRISQSSGASALFSGAAALIWSAHPTWSRDQILQQMRLCSSNYPTKDPWYGWGLVNVYGAVVDGPCNGIPARPGPTVAIEGPTTVQPFATCSWSGSASGTVEPYTYTWFAPGTNGSGEYFDYQNGVYSGGSFTLQLQVQDASGGVTSVSRTVSVSSSAPVCAF